VTNTGGNYVFEAAVSDGSVPACNQTSGQSAGLYSMAPNVSVSYTCSVSVSGDLTNTVNASAVGPAGDTTTASASATVTVTAPITAHIAPVTPHPAAFTPPPVLPSFAVLSISGLKTVVLNTKTPLLSFNTKLSKKTTLVLTLLNSKEQKLASWVKHETSGLHKLNLLLPMNARHAGHETLRITETGNATPNTLSVLLRE
jgi:hypothetical protein